MGKVEDYINSLDGQENLDLPVVVGEILKLHNEEIGTATAKIGQLEDSVTAHVGTIAERDRALSDAKAANWDLVNRIPNTENQPEPEKQENGLPDGSVITLDDLIAK